MQITRIDRHEFNIYLNRGELEIIFHSLADRRAALKKSNCASCGMQAAEIRWMMDSIRKATEEYEKSIREDGNVL